MGSIEDLRNRLLDIHLERRPVSVARALRSFLNCQCGGGVQNLLTFYQFVEIQLKNGDPSGDTFFVSL